MDGCISVEKSCMKTIWKPPKKWSHFWTCLIKLKFTDLDVVLTWMVEMAGIFTLDLEEAAIEIRWCFKCSFLWIQGGIFIFYGLVTVQLYWILWRVEYCSLLHMPGQEFWMLLCFGKVHSLIKNWILTL